MPETAVFPTSIILSCLAVIEKVKPDEVSLSGTIQAASEYLLSQRSESWSWNYSERGTRTSRGSLLPDDLDDTACALSALSETRNSKVQGRAIACFVKHLISCEEKEGGPYHTWIMPKEERPKWRDLDVAVNANIAFFLSLHGVRLASLEAFIDSSVESGRLTSLYYHSPVSIVYFLSRLRLPANTSERLRKMILARRKKKGGWNDSLETALAISALIRLGTDASAIEKDVRLLESQADARGIWKASPFYIEERKNQNAYYAGSEALSTALCLEAISLYEAGMHGAAADTAAHRDAPRATAGCGEKAFLIAVATARQCGEPIASQAEMALRRIREKGMLEHIAGLTHSFRNGMTSPPYMSAGLLARLGAANLLGWAGYTMQDDILDKDADGKLLPASNSIIRRALQMFKVAAPGSKGKTFVWSAFDRIDAANAWESGNATLDRQGDWHSLPLSPPDYKDLSALADKSIGHALGPLVVVMHAGHGPQSTTFAKALAFFEHYIIARQLNDDAHDWIDDLKKGRLNSVSAHLVAEYQKSPGSRELGRSPAELSLPELRAFFWEREIHNVAALIFKHTRLARENLRKSGLMKDDSFADMLLSPLETSAQTALDERSRAIEFIRAYS